MCVCVNIKSNMFIIRNSCSADGPCSIAKRKFIG